MVGVVFLVSSVLVTVPSDDWVTVFSFDLTVPSLLTVLDFSVETCRSHPTSKNDNVKAHNATQVTVICFFMVVRYVAGRILGIGGFPLPKPSLRHPRAFCRSPALQVAGS